MSSRKKGLPTERKSPIPIIVFALTSSYIWHNLSSQSKEIPISPSSSFKPEASVSCVPVDIGRFRFLTILEITKFRGLFTNTTILSIQEPRSNMGVSDLMYGLEVETLNSMIVNIIGSDMTTADKVNKTFVDSGLQPVLRENAALYEIGLHPVMQESVAWISVSNEGTIYCEGDDLGLQAVKSVLNAFAKGFPSDCTFRVGYLLIWKTEKCLAPSFLRFEQNDLKIRWAMLSAFGSSDITERAVFYLAPEDDAPSGYQEVREKLPLNAERAHRIKNYVLGEFVQTASEIRSGILGM